MDEGQERKKPSVVEDSGFESPSGAAFRSSNALPLRVPAPSSIRDDLSGTLSFHGLAGRSPGMRRLFEQLGLLAGHFRVAALEGEDGTGKSAIALVLHRLSPAAANPFVPCTASRFLQSSQNQDWDVEILDRAQGGTLFLDRTHSLDEQQQAGLFRFLLWLEHQQFLGSGRIPRQVMVTCSLSLRRLAATNGFRDDLRCRLTALRLVVPPLRERREDIPLLAQFFIDRFSRTYAKTVRGLGPGTVGPLLRYSWPGNVRELESVMAAASLSTESGWIRPIDLPNLFSFNPLASPLPVDAGQPPVQDFSLDAAIRSHIVRVLAETAGNKLRAAALLGISRSTLYRLLASGHPVPAPRATLAAAAPSLISR
jgi:DNA-binding NtrC family response regulator